MRVFKFIALVITLFEPILQLSGLPIIDVLVLETGPSDQIISLIRNKRQFGLDFNNAFANVGARTGPEGAEALAEAQAANFDSGYGFSGANTNANSFNQNYGGYDFSSANANANAFSQGFGPNGFGSSAANAQAQSFESSGPLGSFGASAANAASQGLSFGPGGLSGSASFGGSQTYNLPGDRDISISYSQGISIGEDGLPTYSGGHAVSVS